MTSLVQKLSKLATLTFSDLHGKNFQQNLNKLTNMMKYVKPADVGFKVSEYFTEDEEYFPPDRPPVDIIWLDFNDLFVMGIFVMYKRNHIPLHNHPNMYGIIKVIHGRVRFETYSHISGNKIVEANKTKIPLEYYVKKNPTIDVSATEDKAMLLTPIDNFHDIQPLTGGVAFMDILSPVYSNDRLCHYFTVKKQSSMEETLLHQVGFDQ